LARMELRYAVAFFFRECKGVSDEYRKGGHGRDDSAKGDPLLWSGRAICRSAEALAPWPTLAALAPCSVTVRLAPSPTPESMEFENFFLIAPKAHRCDIMLEQ
jgi:hypothetical protein